MVTVRQSHSSEYHPGGTQTWLSALGLPDAKINALLDGKPVTGAAVELTLDPDIQRAAWDALGDRKGAVVAIEPSTGRILAMVSKPTSQGSIFSIFMVPWP